MTTGADTPLELNADARSRLWPLVLVAALALFASGAGCLIAQVVVQKYAQVVFGGLNVVIMYMVSFAFIAGLSIGGLLSAVHLCQGEQQARRWAAIEFFNAALVLPFLTLFALAIEATFPLGRAMYLVSPPLYYVYSVAILTVTAFLLATVMGLNYPLAFEALARRIGGARYSAALLVLTANTLGAAAGSVAALVLMPYVGLTWIIAVASACYAIAGLLVLRLPRQPQNPIWSATSEAVAIRFPISVRAATVVLFGSGYAAFAHETAAFRHFTLMSPWDYRTFGFVLAVYLLVWGVGVGTRTVLRLPSSIVLLGLIGSLTCAWLILIRGQAQQLNIFEWGANRVPFLLLFFSPAFFSGWLYGSVHSELRGLTSLRLAILYAANLSGAFLGGIVTGSVMPTVASFIYGLPVGIVLLALLYPLGYRGWIGRMAAAAIALVAAVVPLVGESNPVLTYYRSSQYNPTIDDIREDWAGSVWVARNGSHRYLMVNGRAESPDIDSKYEGFRLFQVETVLAAKRKQDVMIIGLAMGIAPGDMAAKLPGSHFTIIDYSPAVLDFARRYSALNSAVTAAPNVEIVIADGRMATQTDPRAYDIIMEMASGEGTPGISTIKSAEFLRLAKARLKPGGFYFANGDSSCAIRAAQTVFRNVYLLGRFIAASDEALDKAFDFDALADYRAKFGMVLPAHLSTQNGAISLTQIAPLGPGRMTLDTDPCSDFPTRGVYQAGGGDKHLLYWPRWNPD
jgi:spermidine synthase